MPKLKNFHGCVLGRGTALALEIGHRISVDFDFFIKGEISRSLFDKTKRVFKGCSLKTLVNSKDQLTVLIDGVKITFLAYPYPTLYRTIHGDGIHMFTVEEIAATKAYTIGRRAEYKDYIDLYFIISKSRRALKRIIKSAEKKYDKEFSQKLFLEQLVYLKDIEETPIAFIKKEVKKKTLETFFRNEIRKMRLIV
ncbi:MAG: hypothetical protein A2934_00185 [Candidatus Sungbacteria bacterium RIFCSPLOWO2_01_FULL_47_10]|uniref:Nucleotidyl transferase AbiEii/AbiGii toxin family protein n=1 Tax=Candidatus Sungbacteria bacterium RIFCSPLOWO2_01_FULL_47_10 TaxID=1802276 RepID=A0A1G2L8H8_9BACT|nr:MAG: hypothetical protein A2934_00185 [Candidatus Sungbacteria bacterium RIFCSPLOWO2_01_FULL_47_10]